MPPGQLLDRRTFLAASASLTAGSLVAGPLIVTPESPALLVCDRSFQAHLGATSSRTEVVFIKGDVTALWRDHLHQLWRSGIADVAGITAPATLFCLEQLARGCGRKVSMRHPIAGTPAVRWVISAVSTRGFT